MSVVNAVVAELKTMRKCEVLVLQGCGGDAQEWIDGINEMLTEENILLNGTKFSEAVRFQNDDLTCLIFKFEENIKLDIGKLAMWRLKTHPKFGGTWLSDYVPNKLGGFVKEQETADASQDSMNMSL